MLFNAPEVHRIAVDFLGILNSCEMQDVLVSIAQ